MIPVRQEKLVWFYVQLFHGKKCEMRRTRSPMIVTLVTATDPANAAARAYVKCVGRHRARRRQDNGTPEELRAPETEPVLIQQKLRRVGPATYQLAGKHEVWRFRVRRFQMIDRLMARQRRQQWKQFRVALRNPPAN